MAISTSFVLSAAVLLLSGSANAGLYPRGSAVLSVTGKTYDKLIAQSNHTSIVEFYAPWCGHCKNLQPTYEKVAQKLKGLAKVAAIDCDNELNKPFCGSMGIQGFPTLKIVKPGKKAGKPIVEDYQGERSLKAITDAVVQKIPNHVKKVSDKDLDGWLKEGNETTKAVLFSDKGTTSALLRSLAVDYLGAVSFAQIRDKEKEAITTFGITKYPTFLVLPGGSKEAIVYDGDLKKDAMSKFIAESSTASPNPDPAPEDSKKSKPKKEKAEKKAETKPKASSVSSDDIPTSSSEPKVEIPKPVETQEVVVPIPTLEREDELQEACFSTQSKTCILALLPTNADSEDAVQALNSLSEVYHKNAKRNIFPFFGVSTSNPLAQTIRDALSLKPSSDVEVVATNAKRSWVRKYTGSSYGQTEIGDWVDAIKMNEGKKEKLPETLVKEIPETSEEEEPAQEESPVVEEPAEPVEAPKIVVEGPIVVEEPTKETEKEEPRDEL